MVEDKDSIIDVEKLRYYRITMEKTPEKKTFTVYKIYLLEFLVISQVHQASSSHGDFLQLALAIGRSIHFPATSR